MQHGDRSANAKTGIPSAERDPESSGATAGERTYLWVDGMHSVTCERFLESIAESRDGVCAANASYVTETIRVDHDPAVVDERALCEALSTVGYSAYTREEASSESGPSGSRGHRDRGLEDLLGYRYAAGVLFGTFLLLPYVALFYPAHLSSFLGGELFGVFDGSVAFDGSTALMVAPVFLVMTAVILVFTGMPVLRGAYVGVKIRRPNTDLLVAITIVGAYVYSGLAAFAGRGDIFFDVTIVVAATVVAAVFYESLVKRRAMDRLTELTTVQVDEARLLEGNRTTTVSVEELAPGDRVLVRHGERIPVDGVLAEGSCTVDEAVVTGESLPVRKHEGDVVVGGSIVTADAAVLAVEEGATSRIDRLVRTVWDIQSADHGGQRRSNAIAARVAPLVLTVALLVGALHFGRRGDVLPAALTSLAVLVVASPWALGLATPLSIAAGIRAALERGIVVFDETVFERLRDVETVVFDKTGTLTTGAMEVLETDALATLLADVAVLERRSSHPVANTIADALAPPDGEGTAIRPDGGETPDTDDAPERTIAAFEDHGNGVEGRVDGRHVLAGNRECFANRGWTVDDSIAERIDTARRSGRLPVIVGRDGRAEGVIVLRDRPRDWVDETLDRLADSGMEVVVLTGDDAGTASPYEHHPAVRHLFAGVPPEGKVATIHRLQEDGSVAMVGDGTNDAPALARADVGITLGTGTAIASDAADVVLAGDDLRGAVTAFDVARTAHSRTAQNTGLALAYNVVAIPLLAVGLFNPVFIAFSVVVTCILLGINATRSFGNEPVRTSG